MFACLPGLSSQIALYASLATERGPTTGQTADIGKDGKPIISHSGKTLYTTIIDFATKDLQRQFSDAIIAAMRNQHLEAFEATEAVQ